MFPSGNPPYNPTPQYLLQATEAAANLGRSAGNRNSSCFPLPYHVAHHNSGIIPPSAPYYQGQYGYHSSPPPSHGHHPTQNPNLVSIPHNNHSNIISWNSQPMSKPLVQSQASSVVTPYNEKRTSTSNGLNSASSNSHNISLPGGLPSMTRPSPKTPKETKKNPPKSSPLEKILSSMVDNKSAPRATTMENLFASNDNNDLFASLFPERKSSPSQGNDIPLNTNTVTVIPLVGSSPVEITKKTKSTLSKADNSSESSNSVNKKQQRGAGQQSKGEGLADVDIPIAKRTRASNRLIEVRIPAGGPDLSEDDFFSHSLEADTKGNAPIISSTSKVVPISEKTSKKKLTSPKNGVWGKELPEVTMQQDMIMTDYDLASVSRNRIPTSSDDVDNAKDLSSAVNSRIPDESLQADMLLSGYELASVSKNHIPDRTLQNEMNETTFDLGNEFRGRITDVSLQGDMSMSGYELRDLSLNRIPECFVLDDVGATCYADGLSKEKSKRKKAEVVETGKKGKSALLKRDSENDLGQINAYGVSKQASQKDKMNKRVVKESSSSESSDSSSSDESSSSYDTTDDEESNPVAEKRMARSSSEPEIVSVQRVVSSASKNSLSQEGDPAKNQTNSNSQSGKSSVNQAPKSGDTASTTSKKADKGEERKATDKKKNAFVNSDVMKQPKEEKQKENIELQSKMSNSEAAKKTEQAQGVNRIIYRNEEWMRGIRGEQSRLPGLQARVRVGLARPSKQSHN